MATRHLLAGIAIMFGSHNVYADGAPIEYDGHIDRVVGAGAFVLDDGKRQTLIYYRSTAKDQLAVGDWVRVFAEPVQDWLSIGESELQARRVDRVEP